MLTTKGIDDLCLKYFVEAGAIAVRRVKPEDLRRIAKATGAQVVATLADMEGGESFDEKVLGHCAEVSEERVGDGELLYFRGCRSGAACTVVLRGANEFLLDEMDRCVHPSSILSHSPIHPCYARALHDSLCAIRRILENNSLVAGGGAVETAVV